MRAYFASLVLIILAPLAHAQSQEFGYRLTGQITSSDNIRRTEVAPIDENITSIELAVAALKDSGRFLYELDGQYRYLKYLNDTFDAQPIVALSLDSSWELVPERLLWVLVDNFGQLTSNPFQAANPGNRENSNLFATGPDWTIRFGRQLDAIVRGRYAGQWFETSNADNSRVAGELEILRPLSEGRSLSVIFSSESVDFKDFANQGYGRQAAFFRYAGALGASDVQFDAGINQIVIDGEKAAGNLFRASIERESAAGSSIQIDASKMFSDSGLRLAGNGSGLGSIGSAQRTVANGIPLELIQASMIVARRRGRSALNGTVEFLDENFLSDLAEDRRIWRAGAEYEFSLSVYSTIGILGAFQRTRFSSIEREDDDREYSAYFRRQLGRSFDVIFTVSDASRRSTRAGRSYDEFRIFLSLAYSRGQLFEEG